MLIHVLSYIFNSYKKKLKKKKWYASLTKEKENPHSIPNTKTLDHQWP